MIVTTIIPARCSQEELRRCLKQLQRQTTQPHHIVIVDEADDPLWKPEDLLSDTRVTLVRDPDRKPGERNPGLARNYGVKWARDDTTHYLFCDSGILFYDDAVQSLVQTLAQDADFVTSFWVGLPKEAPYFETAETAELWARENNYLPTPRAGGRSVIIDHQLALIPRPMFEALGGYDTKAFPHWGFECQDFTFRALLQGERLRTAVRATAKMPLYIYHPWHPADRDVHGRGQEAFKKKWGMPFSNQLTGYCMMRGAKNRNVATKEDADEPSPSPGT